MAEESGELIPKGNSSEELKGLLELGSHAITVFAEQGESQNKLAGERLKLEEKKLDADQSAFKYKFAAIFAVILGIFCISFGLIFIKGDTNSGILVLSHVVSLLAGAFAGWGWKKGHE